MAIFHAKLGCLPMAALVLLLGILVPTTGADTIGACYGRDGNNLPSQADVVALYKSKNIGRMRLYYPDQGTLQALSGSNIELMLGLPNTDLKRISSSASEATSWVQTNVKNYPGVKIKYIAVGNEVIKGNSQDASLVLPAMRNIHNALVSAGLQSIKVSTAIDNGQVDHSYPPSAGAFKGDVQSYMSPIISYLASIGSPLLVNLYTYFSHIGNPSGISIQYATFTNSKTEFTDNGKTYWNLFDAILDAHYSALERVGGSNVEIVVSESGWPSAGGNAASMDNARTYNQNLIYHVLHNGTPKRPSKTIETYVFSMFNENLKPAGVEQNWGLFYPNKQPVYSINFS